jgi:hypothetical protein
LALRGVSFGVAQGEQCWDHRPQRRGQSTLLKILSR